jgi:hypothetical protein
MLRFRSIKALQKFMLGSRAGPQPFQSGAISRPRQGLQIGDVPSHRPNGAFSAQIAASASRATLNPPAVSLIAPQSKPSSHSRNTFSVRRSRSAYRASGGRAMSQRSILRYFADQRIFALSQGGPISLTTVHQSGKNNLWPNCAAADEPVGRQSHGLDPAFDGRPSAVPIFPRIAGN